MSTVSYAQTARLSEHPEVASQIRLLEAWIEQQMKEKGVPGMSVGIVYDQELIYARGFGFGDLASKTPADGQTPYRVASITKLFTATAIMQLRDAGKLQLDDPIAKYLPQFNLASRFADDPSITIRGLLTHTAGMPRDMGRYWTDDQFITRDQLYDGLARQEAVFAPETRWKYSNLAFSLAGEVVTSVSGESYEDYIRRRILEPLGMAASQIAQGPTSRLATGYGPRQPDGSRQVLAYSDTKALSPAAGLTTNVTDLARFISLQLGNGKVSDKRFFNPATLREMHRVHWLQPDWKSGWGIGWAVVRLGDKTVLSHSGLLAGYSTNIAVSPADKLGVIVLTNASDGTASFYSRRALEMMSGPTKRATASATTTPRGPDPTWRQYVGFYASPRFGIPRQVLIINDELVLISPSDEDPTEKIVRLVPEGKHVFRMMADGPINTPPVGELVEFEVGADGRAIQLSFPGGFMKRE